jgi:hypothetical protein
MKDIVVTIFIFVAMSATVYGWCMNIYKLFGLTALDGELVARAVGIVVAPLGVILGFV